MTRPPPRSPLFPYTTLFRSDTRLPNWSPSITGEIRARRSLMRSEEHTSELQSLRHLVCRLLLEKKHVPAVADGQHPGTGAGGAGDRPLAGRAGAELASVWRTAASGAPHHFFVFFN